MAEFLAAHKKVAQNEGGYANVDGDTGMETYAGISRKFFPSWKGWKIVDAHQPLSHNEEIDSVELKGMVRQFYKANFWDLCRGDSIDSQEVATFIYDWFVNSGTAGIKEVQKVLGVTADGNIGNITLSKINAYDDTLLLSALAESRRQFYRMIVAKDATQKKFLRGWLNRVDMLA